jgi:CarboxypepD_reg-like domain/TonB-dependent Receptor Plug Domain
MLPALVFGQAPVTLSGYATDAANGEALIGATIAVPALKVGATTNAYGFFSLTLPAGAPASVEMLVSYVGYTPERRTVQPEVTGQLSFALQAVGTELEEVQVVASQPGTGAPDVRSTAISQIQLTPAQLRNVPAIGGERDVLKVMQLLPGVKRGGEGQTGLQVRGGGPDQNLIILDEAVVYNVSHLFGFLSVFNDDALKDVTLHTGGFPAQYGGRISSVVDIRTREGDLQHYHTSGGVGLLSSRLTVDGPLVKNKVSFLVAGRRSYIDKVLRVAGRDIPYYFYDFNAKLNWRIGLNDRLYYSAYYGDDVLTEPKSSRGGEGDSPFNFGSKLGNMTHTLRWNHLYSDKLFANYSLIYTQFRYEVTSSLGANSLYVASRVGDYTAKLDHDLYLSPTTQLRFGGTATLHRFRPNALAIQAEALADANKQHPGTLIAPTEAAAYVAVEQEVNPRLRLTYGARLSALRTSGGTRTFVNPEPRFGAAWSLNEQSAVKLGVARMTQYVHLVSSSSMALPTDLWYPVTDRVRPLLSDQLTVGYHRTVPEWRATFSAEAYYKVMNRLIEYREGAVLALNDAYEDELVTGRGRAYGVELLARRTTGRFTGWVGYTLSWATRTFPDLNGGRTYFAKYDRRHDLSIVASFDVSRQVSVSSVWAYATGQRLTAATAYFMMPQPGLGGADALPLYSDRNALKLSPSHRLDLSLTWRPHADEPDRRWHGEWQVSAYNVYNRAQPYKVKVVADGSRYKYQQVGLFGFLPAVSYNFSF